MRLPFLPRLTPAELLFSVKCYAGAMLAVFLANAAGLPRPFWALLTSYVVANVLAGAVRSKAVYRFIGTLAGSGAAVLMVPALSNAPELLTLALAGWVGICLFLSLLDRTPRSYVFMLSGYTAALIGFPSVQSPTLIFDTAVARVEEIGLAILCASLVHGIVLPNGLGPSLLGLLDRTRSDSAEWLKNLLSAGAPRDASELKQRAQERRQLAADITQLRLLSTHVPFDVTHLRWTAGALREMHDCVAALTPLLSAVEDRLRALDGAEGGLAEDVTALLRQIGEWLGAETSGSTSGSQADAAIAGTIATFTAAAESGELPPWQRALRIGLAERLDALVGEWRACAELRRAIDAGLTGAVVASGHRSGLGNRVLHRDYGMAALSSLAAMLSIFVCSAFWILTGWSGGSTATMMSAVFCCFFAAMDDPVPALHGFLVFTLWSLPLGALYVLMLMPLVHDFGMLVIVCAPTFLILGCYMARPATTGQGLALVLGIAGTLALYDTPNPDIATFINANLGEVVGILVAARVTLLMRSVGADWSARRIQHAIWRELADLSESSRVAPAAYAVRMLDRIGLLAPRVAQGGASVDAAVADDALRDLRVGVDLLALRRLHAGLAPDVVERVLRGVGGFFRRRSEGRAATWPPTLLADIDGSLATALAGSSLAADTRAVVSALVGLRRNLFPNAPLVLEGVRT